MKFLKNKNVHIIIILIIIVNTFSLKLSQSNLKPSSSVSTSKYDFKNLPQNIIEIITKYSFITLILLPYLFSSLSILFGLLISFLSYYTLCFYLNINVFFFISYDLVSLYLSSFYLVISLSVMYSLSSNMFKDTTNEKKSSFFYLGDEEQQFDCLETKGCFSFEEFIKVIGLTILNFSLIIIERTYSFNKSENEYVDYGEKVLSCVCALLIGIGLKNVFSKKNGLFALALVFIAFSICILINLAGGAYFLIDDSNRINKT